MANLEVINLVQWSFISIALFLLHVAHKRIDHLEDDIVECKKTEK